MFIRNLTQSYLSFSIGNQKFILGPAGVPQGMGYCDNSPITKEEINDPNVQRLVTHKTVEIVDNETVLKDEAPEPVKAPKVKNDVPKADVDEPSKPIHLKTLEEAKAAPNVSDSKHKPMRVVQADEAKTPEIKFVQCAATKANGERCTATISVPMDEYDPDKPYFCGRHKGQRAADYEKTETGWRKR